MSDRTILSELYFQVAKAHALEMIEAVIKAAGDAFVDYEKVRNYLEERSIPYRAIPSEEEYLALVYGKAIRTPFPVALSDNTRGLLAAGLRAFADDLVRGVPLSEVTDNEMQKDTLKRIRQQFLQREPK